MRSLLGYLVLDQPRQRYTHWVEALAALAAPGAPEPLQIDGYFIASDDQALLGLWYFTQDVEAAALVAEVARLAEIFVIDPGCLAEPDRRALQDRLAECDVIVDSHTSVVEALTELVRKARELRSTAVAPARTITPRGQDKGAPRAPLPAPPPVVPRSAPARERNGELQQSGMPMVGSDTSQVPRSSREQAFLQTPPAETTTPPRLGRPAGTRDRLAVIESATEAPARTRGPSSTRDQVRHQVRHVAAGPAGLERPAGLDVLDGAGMMTSAVPTSPARPRVRAHTQSTTDPFLLAFDVTAPTISAQILRGQLWVAAQLSQLSLDSAQLAAVALPRLGDLTLIALSFDDVSTIVRAEVIYVTDEVEALHSGAAQFQVKFVLTEQDREQLRAVLVRARQGNAQLRSPPRRSGRRSLLTWPLVLATPRGAIRAEALDVSERGMFVHPLRTLQLEGTLGFTMVLDDPLISMSGRARVVREISAENGKLRRIRTGYGLEIAELSELDRSPWQRFVERARRRSARRILVGAPAQRFDEIAGGLIAAGYAVIGAIDLVSMLQLAEAERRPADAAVVDAQWCQQSMSVGWVEARLAASGVRCLTLHGDGRRACAEVDRLLGIWS
jgi:hypothetical protein